MTLVSQHPHSPNLRADRLPPARTLFSCRMGQGTGTGWGSEPSLHPPPCPASQGPENTTLSFHFAVKDIPSLMNDVKCLLLLAKVYKSHKKEDVMDTLNKVIDK